MHLTNRKILVKNWPFGMAMGNRKFVQGTSKYRYSINAQEKEADLSENITTAEFWEYDSRLARRWNIDPIYKKYAGESPYLFVGGNPILYMDPDGKDRIVTINHYNQDGKFLRKEVITKHDKNEIIAIKTTTMSSIMGGGSSPVVKRDWYNIGVTINVYEDGKGKEISRKVGEEKAVGGILTTTHGESPVIGDKTWAKLFIGKQGKGYGGIAFYGEGGQGQETKQGVYEDLTMVEITGLMKAMSLGKELQPFEVISEKIREIREEHAEGHEKEMLKKERKSGVQQCESCRAFKKDGQEIDTTGKGIKPNEIKQVPIKEFHE